uniref:non-specific serine/threonine protein kinase n=1 Tax=Pavo cristatus TaxID=9049 RepID=A0A8C9F7N6_PAVCR
MIKHPNVVQLYETLETDNSYYMVMELCLGGDLLDRICDKQRLAEREVRRYTRQILSAVGYLHCHGIVHRKCQQNKDFHFKQKKKPEAIFPTIFFCFPADSQ